MKLLHQLHMAWIGWCGKKELTRACAAWDQFQQVSHEAEQTAMRRCDTKAVGRIRKERAEIVQAQLRAELGR